MELLALVENLVYIELAFSELLSEGSFEFSPESKPASQYDFSSFKSRYSTALAEGCWQHRTPSN